MINYLKGILVSKIENSPNGCSITVEVNNIGYLIHTNNKVLNSLPDVGENIKIYTVLIHKEDNMYLCGFKTRDERDLFLILQSVSGIGTKVALLLLGEFSTFELVNAVLSDDAKLISRTKGIGPKLAKRLILELKDKMTNWQDKIEFSKASVDFSSDKKIQAGFLEAESVLLSLGYTRTESEEALRAALELSENKENSEELLRIALQRLSS